MSIKSKKVKINKKKVKKKGRRFYGINKIKK